MPSIKKNTTAVTIGYEAQLWQMADAQRGSMVDRTHRELTTDDIARIANTYHAWRGEEISPSPLAGEGRGEGEYEDILGFCKSDTLDEIRKHGNVLTPGRYVGAEAQKDDGKPFDEKMKRLTATLKDQFAESARLEELIKKNLKGIGF